MTEKCIYCKLELKENSSHPRKISSLMCENHNLIHVNFFSLPEDDYELVIQLRNNKYTIELIENKQVVIFNKTIENPITEWNYIGTFKFIKNITPENFQDKIEKLLLFV